MSTGEASSLLKQRVIFCLFVCLQMGDPLGSKVRMEQNNRISEGRYRFNKDLVV